MLTQQNPEMARVSPDPLPILVGVASGNETRSYLPRHLIIFISVHRRRCAGQPRLALITLSTLTFMTTAMSMGGENMMRTQYSVIISAFFLLEKSVQLTHVVVPLMSNEISELDLLCPH